MADVFTATIESNVAQVVAADLPALIRAARFVIGGRGKRLKGAIRSEVRRAGLGERLANAIRHSSRDIADGVESTVFSRAGAGAYQGPGGAGRQENVDLVGLLQAEQVVLPNVRDYLAIPLPAAGKGPRGRQPRVTDFPPGSLIAKFKNGHGVLVSKEAPSVALFVLARATHRKKYLSSSKSWKAFALSGLDQRILEEWSRRRASIALQRIA